MYETASHHSRILKPTPTSLQNQLTWHHGSLFLFQMSCQTGCHFMAQFVAEADSLDPFAVEDVLDIGSGEPLFANFAYEETTTSRCARRIKTEIKAGVGSTSTGAGSLLQLFCSSHFLMSLLMVGIREFCPVTWRDSLVTNFCFALLHAFVQLRLAGLDVDQFALRVRDSVGLQLGIFSKNVH